MFASLLSIHEQRPFTDFKTGSFKSGPDFLRMLFRPLSWPLIHWFQQRVFQQNMHDFPSFWPTPPCCMYIKFAPNLTFVGGPCPAPPSCQQKWRLLHEPNQKADSNIWNPFFFTNSYHVNDIMAPASPNFVAEEWTLNTTLGEIKRSGWGINAECNAEGRCLTRDAKWNWQKFKLQSSLLKIAHMLVSSHLVRQCPNHMQFYTLQVTMLVYVCFCNDFTRQPLHEEGYWSVFFSSWLILMWCFWASVAVQHSCDFLLHFDFFLPGFHVQGSAGGVQKAPEVEIIRVDIVPLPRRLGRQLATQRCGCTRLHVQDCGCTS